jgi:hypothetical protein
MIVEKQMEWRLAGETEVLGENLTSLRLAKFDGLILEKKGTKMDPPFRILEHLEKMLNIKRVWQYFLVDMLERAL